MQDRIGDMDHGDGLPHRRAGEQRLDIIANSPLMKVVSYFITTIVLPIVGWALLSLLSEVRELNNAIAKNNTIVALYDLRLTALEQSKAQRDIAMNGLNTKSIEHEIRITNIEHDLHGGKN